MYTYYLIINLNNSSIFNNKSLIRLIWIQDWYLLSNWGKTWTTTAAEFVHVEETDGAEDTNYGGDYGKACSFGVIATNAFISDVVCHHCR